MPTHLLRDAFGRARGKAESWIGDKNTALTKAASWIGFWHKARLNRAAGAEASSARLIRMMLAVDAEAARRLLCDVQLGATPGQPGGDSAQGGACELNLPDLESEVPSNTVMNVQPHDGPGRRRRR